MTDITIIFLTLNKVPKKWARYQKKILIEAIGDTPVITISKIPSKWGTNLIQESEGHSNIYRQILRGAKLATTPYIAVAEDDTLYPREHFLKFRPPTDAFAYNMSRWGIMTWGTPTYFLKPRPATGTLIAPRQLTIDALEERFSKVIPERKWAELGDGRIEWRAQVTLRKSVSFNTVDPILFFNHDFALDPLERAHKKVMWPIRAYDIQKWGRAETIVKKFA